MVNSSFQSSSLQQKSLIKLRSSVQEEQSWFGPCSVPKPEGAVLPVDPGELPRPCLLVEVHHHPGALPEKLHKLLQSETKKNKMKEEDDDDEDKEDEGEEDDDEDIEDEGEEDDDEKEEGGSQ